MSQSHVEEALAFQLKAARITGWVREVEWHPKRKWRSDFLWPVERLIVEVEGGQSIQGGGRHQRSGGFEADCKKYGEAIALGYVVLRFTSGMVVRGEALALIERVLERKRTKLGG